MKNQGIPYRPPTCFFGQGLSRVCPHCAHVHSWAGTLPKRLHGEKNDNVKIDSKNQTAAINSDVSAAFQHLAPSAHLLK